MGPWFASAARVPLDPAHAVPAAVAMAAGVMLAPRVGLARRDLAETLLAALLACALLCHPLGLALCWLAGQSLDDGYRLFGHTSLSVALVGGAAAPLWWKLRGRTDMVRLLLVACAIGSLGYGLVKLGCFMEGCCFGARTFGWWAVQHAPDSAAAGVLGGDHYVHPVQLYEALPSLGLFAWIVFGAGRARPRRLAAAVALLALCRLAVEPLRHSFAEELPTAVIPGLTQTRAVCLVALAIAWFLFHTKHGEETCHESLFNRLVPSAPGRAFGRSSRASLRSRDARAKRRIRCASSTRGWEMKKIAST